MPAIITLTKLHTEGRLSLGDTLTHSETGPHTLTAVLDTRRIQVKDAAGAYRVWEIDFGPDARIVPMSSPTEKHPAHKA